MLARLLFSAVALCLIGALPDAHASRAAGSRDDAGLAPSTAAPGAGTTHGPAIRPAAVKVGGASTPHGR